MIKRILIANRGEIARRIIKTASEMGVFTISLYTSDEKDAPWINEANQSILLGEGGINETYLNTVRILQIAKDTNCDAIHPGYGFLSENHEFALACEKQNIKFIGPSADVIKLMGNKNEARKFVSKIGIPIPQGISGTADEILKESDNLEYPVLIKAVGGGGGKGMHIVHSQKELPALLTKASSEAEKWFGNNQVYIEQYFKNARHIEVQILGDNYDNYIHLYERECTLQRNYQKIIEEAPSPTLNAIQRADITNAALKIARKANYKNAGTIEFLWQDGMFYFLEMNTRIQVEHPVSEMITGIDIVEQQINIANNLETQLRQKDIKIFGHAIQCRIYAENPVEYFKPSAGLISYYKEPNFKHVRLDSTYNSTTLVSSNYDGLLSKVISHEKDRLTAIANLKKSLSTFVIQGIENNIAYLNALLNNALVISNDIHTLFLKEYHESIIEILNKDKEGNQNFAIAAYISSFLNNHNKSVWSINQNSQAVKHYHLFLNNYSFNVLLLHKTNGHELIINEKKYSCTYTIIDENKIRISVNKIFKTAFITNKNDCKQVQIDGFNYELKSQNILSEVQIINKTNNKVKNSISQIISPLHGTISEIVAKQGQQIEQGDKLLTIDSMKTENQILSSGSGIIDKILIKTNDIVKEDDILIKFKSN